MSMKAALILGCLIAAGSVGLLYAIFKMPSLAWLGALVLSVVYTALFLASFAEGSLGRSQHIRGFVYLLVMYACVAGGAALLLEALRSRTHRCPRFIVGAVCLAVAAILTAAAFKPLGRVDPALGAWAAKGHDVFVMGLLVRVAQGSAEFSSFAELFRYFEEGGADLGADGHMSGKDLVATSADAPNPFPGVLNGERYGRLDHWPAGAPPKEVPLLWDEEDFKGSFHVAFLNGNYRQLTAEELSTAIDQLRQYGPVSRWNGGEPDPDANE